MKKPNQHYGFVGIKEAMSLTKLNVESLPLELSHAKLGDIFLATIRLEVTDTGHGSNDINDDVSLRVVSVDSINIEHK